MENIHSNLSLPHGWIVEVHEDKLTLCKLQQSVASTSSSKQPVVITHCLEVKKGMVWTLFVHGKKVDTENCTALRTYASHHNVNELVARIHSLNVCAGHPETRFSEISKARKGKFNSSSGDLVAFTDDYCPISLNGETYDSTIRTVRCELLVSGVKCEACKDYRSTLRSMCHRHDTHVQGSTSSSAVSSHTNYRYLKTPERKERMSNLKAELDHSKREIDRLRAKIKDLQENEGVCIDDKLEQDLQTIMEEKTSEIRDKHPPGSFLRLFWDQQLMAVQTKERRQLRWHPMIIKWCLNLKFLSSGAYGALRSVLSLPSERTLRDYTHWIDSTPGFHADVDKQLMDEAKVKTVPDFQKYVCLLFDEVRIKEDLVYDKHSSQIIGFINLGGVNNQLLRFQQLQTSDADSSLPPPVAKHMLVFMVRGLFQNLEFPYVQFPCDSLSGDITFPLVWECIKRLEAGGLKVPVSVQVPSCS